MCVGIKRIIGCVCVCICVYIYIHICVGDILGIMEKKMETMEIV